MQVLLPSQNNVYQLQRPLFVGGEAEVHPFPGPPQPGGRQLLAKVFLADGGRRRDKIAHWIHNGPVDYVTPDGFKRYPGPEEELLDPDTHELVGYTMHRLTRSLAAEALADAAARPAYATEAFLLRAGASVAAAVRDLHAAGFVVGDLQPANVMVDDQARASIIDIDSLQARLPGGRVLRCDVGIPEYTPPELQGADLALVDRSEAHDHFGLAVVLFELLVGCHPFAGRYRGIGPVPSLVARIQAGAWPFDPGQQDFAPPAHVLPLGGLPPEVGRLFRRAFVDGHASGWARPSAGDWAQALADAARQGRPLARRAYYQALRAVRGRPPRGLVLAALHWPVAAARLALRAACRRWRPALALGAVLLAAGLTLGVVARVGRESPRRSEERPNSGLATPALWQELRSQSGSGRERPPAWQPFP